MGKDRLKRLLIILLIIGFLLIGGKVFADWQAKKKASGQDVSLSVGAIGEKVSDFGESVLGKAVEVLPGGKELKEKIVPTETPSSNTQIINQNTTQTETITQTEKVETKTQEIIEIIKELPATELEKIKKQIFKDFCQDILKE